ncbi:O-methyltransferase [Arachidicoccus terrestris]|uniref:O-methyltransferase n=1 Tax=Arachidicoccus terrestris TaxID=2875539 RepID=UPI001CC52C25|nr:O-methyltransferase [Arachidicoccus terrestris]UAY55002.1 O-methyltransferase [Arachidicoccus terrestris]
MDLIHPTVEQFTDQMTTPADPLLQEIEKETYANHSQPHMISGHVQGRLLSFLSQMLQPQYILEIGTFTGYSALCLAEGLTGQGELHTLELREEDAGLAQSYFDRSIHKNKIYLHRGNAVETIPTLNYKWDLVFIDADKTGYIDYYELVMERLSPKGIILVDNVLFHGQIFETPTKGKSAKAIQAFNDHVAKDPRSEQVLLSVRDGLLMIKKKS